MSTQSIAQSKTERCKVVERESGKPVGFCEVGTFVHDGQEFSAQGAYVDPEHAAGYPKFEGSERVGAAGKLTDWAGKEIGSCLITAAWPIRSWMGPTMFQIRVFIPGHGAYTGRGMGNGMLWRGRKAGAA